MISDPIVLEGSEEVERCVVPAAKIEKRGKSSGKSRLLGAVSKKVGISRTEKKPKKGVSYGGFLVGDCSSIDPLDVLEDEIKTARLEISQHFTNLKIKTELADTSWNAEMDRMVYSSLANINDGKRSPQNEFIINSLIGNYEEIIEKIGEESIRDVIHTSDGFRKVLVQLVNRIQRDFRLKDTTPSAVVRIAKSDTMQLFCKGLFSIFAALVCVFPDYLPRSLVSSAAFYQSTFLGFVLFAVMYFMNGPYN